MELIERVHRQFIDQTRHELAVTDDVGEGQYRWRGHRLHVVDGSTDSMPDTPALRAHYGVPSPSPQGLGFPAAHLMRPHRPSRLEPRVLKRAKKQFPYMARPRAELKAQLRALHFDTA